MSTPKRKPNVAKERLKRAYGRKLRKARKPGTKVKIPTILEIPEDWLAEYRGFKYVSKK